jgi:hypothetical protein
MATTALQMIPLIINTTSISYKTNYPVIICNNTVLSLEILRYGLVWILFNEYVLAASNIYLAVK